VPAGDQRATWRSPGNARCCCVQAGLCAGTNWASGVTATLRRRSCMPTGKCCSKSGCTQCSSDNKFSCCSCCTATASAVVTTPLPCFAFSKCSSWMLRRRPKAAHTAAVGWDKAQDKLRCPRLLTAAKASRSAGDVGQGMKHQRMLGLLVLPTASMVGLLLPACTAPTASCNAVVISCCAAGQLAARAAGSTSHVCTLRALTRPACWGSQAQNCASRSSAHL